MLGWTVEGVGSLPQRVVVAALSRARFPLVSVHSIGFVEPRASLPPIFHLAASPVPGLVRVRCL